MQKTKFEFKLTTPFKFSSGGTVHEAERLLLKEASNSNENFARMQQAFIRAIFGNAKKSKQAIEDSQQAAPEATEGEKPEMDGEAMYLLLLASDIDIIEFKKYFRAMLMDKEDPLCIIEDMETMKYETYAKMSRQDTDRLIGEYIANFIMASSNPLLGKKSAP